MSHFSSSVESLCRSASSTKARGQSIGYRGIAFKSLAAPLNLSRQRPQPVLTHIEATAS